MSGLNIRSQVVAVVGANGFIGSRLVQKLEGAGKIALKVVRKKIDGCPNGNPTVEVQRWLETGCVYDGGPVGVVVYCAGYAHSDRLDWGRHYQKNCWEPVETARRCRAAGVRRFIYLSTVQVLGTSSREPLLETGHYMPTTPYAAAKAMAEEQLLKDIDAGETFETTVVRPSLVYGAGVGGNVRKLIRAVRVKLPLPIRGELGKRSMVSIGNLCDFLGCCIDSDSCGARILHVTDGVDMTVAELVEIMRRSYSVSPVFPDLPIDLVQPVAWLPGLKRILARIQSPFQVSTTRSRELVGWTPIETPDQAIAAMCLRVD